MLVVRSSAVLSQLQSNDPGYLYLNHDSHGICMDFFWLEQGMTELLRRTFGAVPFQIISARRGFVSPATKIWNHGLVDALYQPLNSPIDRNSFEQVQFR
ncbi:hypothetical protein RRG08_047454 [Elysia crispata]|uniref:Uncharacterized protein n=1 Tax=Elysia crispata TaxID=231223 RepID=A0AAE0YUE7_9GAST|nr:hypothetical protein RRG08_047454 [Elysia crispata]